MARASATGGLRRFKSPDIDPSRNVALSPDHPAVVEGRTIYPSTVVGTLESPRFLVSGQNNSKLGGRITKGERAGWPIYQLTLEERATCPRSCAVWSSCYGNGMHLARRHAVDGEFLGALRAEVLTVARTHPEGLLVRLHTLGDFFSVEYVLMWGELLALLPQLHVFGYTARREDDPDPKSRRIAKAIRFLTQGAWSRFAIRTSHTEPGRERSIVVGVADPDRPKVIVCPAQTHATECCGTCGLCWADGARDKTIAFMRHGASRPVRALAPSGPVRGNDPVFSPGDTGTIRVVSPVLEPIRDCLSREQRSIVLADRREARAAAVEIFLRTKAAPDGLVVGVTLAEIADGTGVSFGSVIFVLRHLEDAGRLRISKGVKPGGSKRPPPNTYALLGSPAPEPPPAEAAQVPIPVAAARPVPADPAPIIWPPRQGTGTVSALAASYTPSGPKAHPEALLRTRIMHALADREANAQTLAAMLDAKELTVCQVLNQLKHEGLVHADRSAGNNSRSIRWSLPIAEAAQ